MKLMSHKKALLLGVATAISAPSAAFADEIIVTATKRPQTLQEVPVAVSVVDDSVIEQAKIDDLLELQTLVPSLRISQLQSSSQTSFTIRGFGNGANNPGIEPSVGVFIDGVYRSRSAAAILDLPVLERVEILRGPQSTLFGKNVSAGAISITTKAPTDELEGSLEASYGNFDSFQVRGSVSGPITEGLSGRVSGSYNKADGYYDNIVNGDDVNNRNRWAIRGQLQWDAGDDLTFRLIGDWNEIDERCCGTIALSNGIRTLAIAAPAPFGLGQPINSDLDPFAREVAFDLTPTNFIRGRGVSLQADWDLGGSALTSITAYRNQDDDSLVDADLSSIDGIIQPNERNYETFTQEVRIASTGDNQLDWLVGAFFFDETVINNRDIVFSTQARQFADVLAAGLGVPTALSDLETALGLMPGATFFAPGTGVFGEYELDNRSFSFFGQLDYNVTDRLTLSGGISYINDRKEASGNSLLTDGLSLVDLEQVGFGEAFFTLTGLPPTPANIAAAGGMPIFPMGPTVFDTATSISQTECDSLTMPSFPCNTALGLAEFQFFQPQVNFPDPANPLDNGLEQDDKVTYTLRAIYDVTDEVSTYFTYSTGWKAAAFNLSSDSTVPDATTGFGRSAGPEEVELFEFGLKANFDKGYINIALFDQTIEGFQSNIFTGTGFLLANAGEQNARGFEIESLYRPVPQLTLTFGATYVDQKYDSFTQAACVSFDTANCSNGELTRDLSGTTVPGVHPLSIATSATYEHDFNEWLSGFARVEYQHETRTNIIENVPVLGGRGTRDQKVVNASVGLVMDNGFEVSGFVRNATDNEFSLSGFPVPIQDGSFAGYANEPRTYGVTVRKTF